MFSRISNRTLAKVAVYGAVASISGVFYMRWSIEKRLRGQPYYTSALQLLEQHSGASALLGAPVLDRGFDLSDKVNFCDGKEAHFEVMVRGRQDRGKYEFWARRGRPEDDWDVYRAELELKSRPNQRLVVKSES